MKEDPIDCENPKVVQFLYKYSEILQNSKSELDSYIKNRQYWGFRKVVNSTTDYMREMENDKIFQKFLSKWYWELMECVNKNGKLPSSSYLNCLGPLTQTQEVKNQSIEQLRTEVSEKVK